LQSHIQKEFSWNSLEYEAKKDGLKKPCLLFVEIPFLFVFFLHLQVGRSKLNGSTEEGTNLQLELSG
jgi:hypothetical protein